MTGLIESAPVPRVCSLVSKAAAKVLLVEDDADLRAALEIRLQASGLQASSLSDGREALEEIGRIAPDVLILDLGLPGIDGLDLLERLPQVLERMPGVIVLSAWDEERCQPLAVGNGADLYLEKPARFEDVLAGVQFLLNDRA